LTEAKRKLIDENGIRTDGRRWDELRPLKIEVGVVRNADGSALI
jgi:exosome complex component RRP41